MTSVFPWTKESAGQLHKGFAGNTAFKVHWPWAPFHEPGFKALKWAADKKITNSEFYNILSDLSCPSAPFRIRGRLRRARLIDHIDRILPLDPSLAIKKTFIMANENINAFSDDSAILLTIDDLIAKDPSILGLWKPEFIEEKRAVERWLSTDQTLLKAFQESSSWSQLRVVEGIVGLTKASSLLNFERIY